MEFDDPCSIYCLICIGKTDRGSSPGPYRPMWPGDPGILNGRGFYGIAWYEEDDLDEPGSFRL